jgi:phosphatidylglycerophosphatase A
MQIRAEFNTSDQKKKIPFLINFFGTGFFSGYFPFASGTFGSLIALLFYFIPGFDILYLHSGLIIIFFIIGVYTAGKIELIKGHDPSIVVIDEFIGMWIALLFVPKIWYYSVGAFFLFRFFDIAKIYPASYFDRRKGGFSIMFDDVIAGIYANISLQIIILIFK